MIITIQQLKRKSLLYRRDILRWIKHAGAGHTSGSLSCIDILNVLYNRVLRVSPATFADSTRDRYVQSKGHAVEALFVVLADRGFFSATELETMGAFHSHYVGHPTRKIRGIEQNTGALGHGLPICTGMALGGKMDAADFKVFTLLGDGELAEGSNWEALMAAAHYRLDNLTVIVDKNLLQITGRTRDVMNSEPIADKFAAFGWAVRSVDGHDVAALAEALSAPPSRGQPSVVIAHTIKGKGVSFMEGVGKWHHGAPNDEEYLNAIAELDAALAEMQGEGI